MSTATDTHTWPELAEGLYRVLTGRGAEISYAFDEVDVHVPASTRHEAPRAHWTINGTIRVSTTERPT